MLMWFVKMTFIIVKGTHIVITVTDDCYRSNIIIIKDDKSINITTGK